MSVTRLGHQKGRTLHAVGQMNGRILLHIVVSRCSAHKHSDQEPICSNLDLSTRPLFETVRREKRSFRVVSQNIIRLLCGNLVQYQCPTHERSRHRVLYHIASSKANRLSLLLPSLAYQSAVPRLQSSPGVGGVG